MMPDKDAPTPPERSDEKSNLTAEQQKIRDYDDAAATQLAEAFAKALNEGVLKDHPTS